MFGSREGDTRDYESMGEQPLPVTPLGAVWTESVWYAPKLIGGYHVGGLWQQLFTDIFFITIYTFGRHFHPM